MKYEDLFPGPLKNGASDPNLERLLQSPFTCESKVMASTHLDLSGIGKELEPEDTEQFDYTPDKPIIGFQRNLQEKIETLVSDSSEIKTDRRLDMGKMGGMSFLFGSWYPNREATVVPLAIEETSLIGVQKSEDYSRLPDHVKELFDNGKILRTSEKPTSNFQALMYVQNSNPPEGRTGVLLYKGEPVTVDIDGKEFIVEIKGVGVPNGNNTVNELMARSSYFGQGSAKYGGLEVEQGRREFRNLETLRTEGSKTFQESNSPRAALLVEYDGNVRYYGDETEQGYLLRLAPSSVRASFNGNEAFPEIKDKSNKTARDLASQFVECMNLDSILIHTCAHSENLVLTNDGFKFTDFSDMRTLAELENPHEIVRKTFTEYVDEIPNRTNQDIEDYARTLSTGLGIEWSDDYKYTSKLAEAIWTEWVAPRVFQQRLHGQNAILAKTLSEIELYVGSPDEIDAKIIENGIRYEGYYREDASQAADNLKDLDEWIPKFVAIQGDINACRKFYEGRDYAQWDEVHLLSLAKSEYKRRVNAKSKAEEKLRDYTQKADALAKIQGDPVSLAAADKSVVPGIGSAIYFISNYLKNEIDVLSSTGTEETKPMLERANTLLDRVEKLRDDPSNGYVVVHHLRENLNFLLELTKVYQSK